jgi:hypothetical protein
LRFYGKPYKHVKANRPELYVCDMREKRLIQLETSELLTDESPAAFTLDDKE